MNVEFKKWFAARARNPDRITLEEAFAAGARPQPAPSFADAYQGAMEEVAIWKKRALEAEKLNRKFVAEINGPTYMGGPAQPAPSVPERITHDQAPHVYSQEAAEGYADGWNACVKKIVAAAPQNCIKAAMEAQREGCAEIVLQAAHKAADCNNLRDYELLRALSIEVAKAPEAKP